MARFADFVAASRPRTLPAALAPVGVGVAVATTTGHVSAWRAALCFVVSIAIQIGTNYANDYADGVKGTDTVRVGPTRLVASGLATPAVVRGVAIGCFGVAAATGAAIVLTTAPWLIAVGAVCIAAGWFYTAGSHPYGYIGGGEIAVFVFFGMVAVTGTVYVSAGSVPAVALVAAVPVGLIAVALLVVNNLRDIPTDRVAGKKTLAVRLGARWTRRLYIACIVGAFVSIGAITPLRHDAAIALVAIVLAVAPIRLVRSRAEGRELIAVLGMTGVLQLVFGGLLALGIAL